MGLVLGFCSLPALAVGFLAQQAIPFPTPARLVELPPLRPAWYSGDTHEHLQLCSEQVISLEDVLARMQAEQLDVANVLIWDRPNAPFQTLVCRVTGQPDPLSTAHRVLQYGVEASGLDCGKWGHLIALGVRPDAARIAAGTVALGACDDTPGLGLGCEQGDGTGSLNAPVARSFLADSGVVTGYAHTAWPVGLYHPDGLDWQNELVATDFTTDARVLDPLQKLAFPDLEQLGLEPRTTLHDGGSLRAFLPLLGAVDAVLGNVQFIETTFLGQGVPMLVTPPASWNALYYKLLSAGVRIGLSGGSDRACTEPFVPEHPRTYVLLDELSYPAWIAGVAEGRTSVGVPGIRVDLEAAGEDVGSELEVTSTTAIPIVAEVHSSMALTDVVELVVDGVVREQLSVSLPSGGSTTFSFSSMLFPESAWLAVRLGSQRAHTAAIWVIVDGQPIADAGSAEYWMLWCDRVAKTTLDHPELEVFGCQEAEGLQLLADARSAFRALRDVEGFDPSWDVERRGRSTPACSGPIAIGTTGPVQRNGPFRVTCVHAPPDAQGELLVSRHDVPSGACVDGARLFVSLTGSDLLGVYPAFSTPGGYAEVEVPALGPGVAEVHLQFRWTNPPGCASRPCSGSAQRSASDALRVLVH